jgi:hypothetical protein
MHTAYHLQTSLLLLLQGMIILTASVLVFITPQQSTDEMLLIAGFTALAMAVIYLLSCFFGEDQESFVPDLCIAFVMGLLSYRLINHHYIRAEWLLFSVSGLLLLLALNVFRTALDMKYIFTYWWMAAVMLVISSGVAYFIASDKMFPGLSKIVSVYLLMLGVLMVWLSVLDRRVEKEYRKTLQELREN